MKSESKPNNDLESGEPQHTGRKKKWETPRFERHDAKQSTLANKLLFPMETTLGSAGPTS